VIFLIAAVIISLYLWLSFDAYPIAGHDLLGIFPSVQLVRDIKGWGNDHLLYDMPVGRYYGSLLNYPPLSFIVLAYYYLIFGLQGQMAIMVNAFYICLILGTVYLIGKELFDAKTGLLAAFLLSCFPGFIAFSRSYWLEFGVIAYVCMVIYFLLKTDFFRNRFYSVMLGFSLALAYLHKNEFIPFVAVPLAIAFFMPFLKDREHARSLSRIMNASLAVIISFLCTHFWWSRYGVSSFGRMLSVFSSTAEIDITGKATLLEKLLAPESLFFYFNSLLALLGGVFLVGFWIMFIFLSFRIVLKKEAMVPLLYLFSWFCIPFGVFTFTLLQVKYPTHILALLPAIALLISAGIYYVRPKVLQILITVLVCAYGVNVFFSSLYAFGKSPLSFVRSLGGLNAETIIFRHMPEANNFDTFYPPRKEELEKVIQEILQFINQDTGGGGRAQAVSVYQRPALKNNAFYYYVLTQNYPLFFFASHFKMATSLEECDYLVIEQEGNVSLSEILNREYGKVELERKHYREIFQSGINDFRLIKEMDIPYGKERVLIYKRR